jgi:hypothetical protein
MLTGGGGQMTGGSPQDGAAGLLPIIDTKGSQREFDRLRGRHAQGVLPQDERRSPQQASSCAIGYCDPAGEELENRQQCALRNIPICAVSASSIEGMLPKQWRR